MNDPARLWQSLRLTVESEAVEAIEFAFNSLESLGTEIDYMNRSAAGVCVVGYFDQLPNDEVLQDEIHYALRCYNLDENAIVSIERAEIENADWLAEWKEHWKPTTVGRFVIAPPWENVDEADKIVIRIEPNMAFGTGTHETTQLCLVAIDKYYAPGDSFLDAGTGTGILAIAAAKLSGRNTSGSECVPQILACDTAPESIKIARENAQLNGVAELIRFEEGTVDTDTPKVDFICANLTLDAILPILPLLIERSNAYIVLSGILTEQQPQISSALSQFTLDSSEFQHAGEWISVVLKK